MTTSTLAQILTKIRAVIVGCLPATLPDVRFMRPTEKHVPLREWALANAGSQCARKFEVKRFGPREDPGVIDPQAYYCNRQVLVEIAYPAELAALFGREDLDDLEDVIEADALQIRDALFSPTGLANDAHQETAVVIEDLDRVEGPVWFQPFTLTVKYFSPQLFT